MRYKTIGITAVLLILCVMSMKECDAAMWAEMFPGESSADQKEQEKSYPILEKKISLEVPEKKQILILEENQLNLLPERWYAGDYGKKPTVKSQGKYGTCWALTATSAIEAMRLPESDLVFSADHMALQNDFTVDLQVGGDYLMTMAYLSGWQGPVAEEEDPYGDAYSPDGLEAAVHVQEIQVLNQVSLSEVKQVIYEYGAVQTSLYMDRAAVEPDVSYYNDATTAYYYPENKIQNHDVLILGWDDSFSRLKFAQIPPMDGAYICQNTWGNDFGEDGIFYVSYADANIMQSGLIYSRVEDTDNFDCIYQADSCGWQGSQGYGNNTCWMANVYTATEVQESLEAVGFYAVSDAVSYDAYIVHDFETEADFERMEYLQSGSLERAGYYTVDLKLPERLDEEERFAVVVQVTTPNGSNPIAVEYRAGEYTKNVTVEGKESYLSRNAEVWERTQERYATNICLKAYTTIR